MTRYYKRRIKKKKKKQIKGYVKKKYKKSTPQQQPAFKIANKILLSDSVHRQRINFGNVNRNIHVKGVFAAV